MKLITLTIMLITISISFATVLNGTSHYSDAVAVNSWIRSNGYSNKDFQVMIDNVEDLGMCYLISFPDEFWSASNADYAMFGTALGAVGIVSAETSWTSTYMTVYFSNKLLIVTTANARWLGRNFPYMTEDEVGWWILDNTIISEY